MTLLCKIIIGSKRFASNQLRPNVSRWVNLYAQAPSSPVSPYTLPIYASTTRCMSINRMSDSSLTGTDDLMSDIRSGDSKPFYGVGKTAIDMDFYDPLTDDFYPEGHSSKEEEAKEQKKEKNAAMKQAVKDELDSRTGRLWTDPYEITDEDWGSGKKLDDLTDWTPDMASRTSIERIQVFPGGVPTLDQLCTLTLPLPYPPHPALGNPKPYNSFKKQRQYETIYSVVSSYADERVEKILNMSDWDEKQNAVDDLFEQVYEAIKDHEKLHVLKSLPQYPELVEKALENSLRSVIKKEKTNWDTKDDFSNTGQDGVPSTVTQDKDALPVFMDLLQVEGALIGKDGIPNLVRPLKPHARDGPGRMVEEWELASHQETKRIMLRSCMQTIARHLVENMDIQNSRIYVTGRKGTGKSASLLAIVAAARQSGHIVLYLPDGDRLRKHGYYNEVNKHFEETMFDLPVLAKELCSQLLDVHSKDMQGLVVTQECLSQFMSADQSRKLNQIIHTENDNDVSLTEILRIGSDSTALSSSCYGAAMETLMNQTIVPFTMVMDDFNCYYDHGHYFNEEYDPEVRKPIPLHKFTLFKPLLDAMGVYKNDHNEFFIKEPKLICRGGVVAGITESHSVARAFTDGLSKAIASSGAKVVDVPTYSPIEVDHILSHFEIIGIGRLRFDRGATVMDNQEVAFLRMLSCGVGQKLLDACIT